MTAEQGALFPAGDGHAGVLGGVPFNASAVLRSLRPGVDAGQVPAARGRFTAQQLNVVHHVAKSRLSLVRLSMVHVANSADAVLALAAEQEFEFSAGLDVVGAVRAVQDRALPDLKTRGHFDYDDLLDLPLNLDDRFESLDVALVDEAQDFSRLQHRLVRHVVGRRGRVIFVGDDRQATHGFSGADKGGLTRAAEVFDAVTLPLTVTFRCPASHVELAARLSDGIEAAPGAATGEVRRVRASFPLLTGLQIRT